ncbi:MAG: hypothetical protein H0V29_03050, partial [Thermoleophilaceae bacterium]|nr:hypothetical protein [Thermoleophilaceae bacterium]
MAVTTHKTIAGAAGVEGPDSTGEAVARAVAALHGAAPGIVFAFPDGRQDPVRAAAAADEASAGAPVVGLTSGGEAIAAGKIVNGASAIAFEESVKVGIGVATGLGADPAAAGQHAAASALAALDPGAGHPVLLLFFDTTASDQSKVIDGAYAVAGGRIPLAGGASGGERPSHDSRGCNDP